MLAVDPTSPFSGGAVLGDRLRMQAHAADEGVFIRSMATRGHLGGLARATGDAALVLDAAGKDIVIIETVGVGQDEVDIIRTADVSIVTLVPGTGDDVQALKAGIMEIADIFVVNKADREGADRLVAAIEANLSLQSLRARRMAAADSQDRWRPPARACRSWWTRSWRFREQAEPAQAARRRRRSEFRLRELVVAAVHGAPRAAGCSKPGELAAMVERVAAREIDPYTAADELAGARPDRRESRIDQVDPVAKCISIHESRSRSCRHRGERSRRGAARSIATRSGSRSKRRRRCRASACARISSRSAQSSLELLRGDGARLADREVHREARPRPASHHAARRRHSRGAGPAQGARRAARSTTSRARAPKARWSRSSIPRAPRACWSS